MISQPLSSLARLELPIYRTLDRIQRSQYLLLQANRVDPTLRRGIFPAINFQVHNLGQLAANHHGKGNPNWISATRNRVLQL